MDKLAKIKMKKNIKLMKESTEQCVQFLNSYTDSFPDAEKNSVVVTEFKQVIQHQKNMVQFFGILEQQLNK